MSVNISAASVKELRERTGAGMMECKKALVEANGELDGAIEVLRKSGIAKADKRAGNVAAEGAISIIDNGKQAVMIEVNSQTDFASRNEDFTSFVSAVAKTALAANIQTVDELLSTTLQGTNLTVEMARQALVAKIGENVQIRRLVISNPTAVSTGNYLHGSRIGVLVELNTDNQELARDIAMHIAASKPIVVSPDQVSKDLIEKEKEIYAAQAATSGKPPEIIEKMVVGRLKKFLDEVSLVGQPFVKDPDINVGSLLNKHKASVLAFYRYEVGEGIEKVTEDFREAVMSQIKGA